MLTVAVAVCLNSINESIHVNIDVPHNNFVLRCALQQQRKRMANKTPSPHNPQTAAVTALVLYLGLYDLLLLIQAFLNGMRLQIKKEAGV